MNKEMMKKVVVSKVVDLAVQTSVTSQGPCTFFFLGKPNAKCKLVNDDYVQLATFIKRNQS